MADDDKGQSGGVNISGGSVNVGGDIVGRDKIVTNIQQINQRALTAAEEAEQRRNERPSRKKP